MEKIIKADIDKKLAMSYPLEHRWHNRFHLEMPFGLINDPNGLVWADGYWHIFYQWNPLGCEHKNKCWAHVKTADFINYTTPKLALWPSDVHDKDGCYSGCGTVVNDKVKLLYTCNRKEGERRIPAQRWAELNADGTVSKGDIIIADHPAEMTGHFRDPYVFTRHGQTYLVIGAQRAVDNTGTALIYAETTNGWQQLGEIKTRLCEFGYMWECPNLLQFGNYDVLIFCPQGLAAREYDRQNIHQAGYIAGHLSLTSLDMLQHTKFQELDRGFDFYAPQVVQHEGRHILYGWMGLPDKEAECTSKQQGWMYCLTMPRELRLRQGHIYSRPAREMRDLRIMTSQKEIAEQNCVSYAKPISYGSEILLNFDLGKAQKLAVTLQYGLEKLCFTYDRKQQVMEINRDGMTNGGRGKRQFKLFADDKLNMQLFVDRSAVEVFFQHGEEVASILVFPTKNIAPELQITADAALTSICGQIWQLADYKYHNE